MFWALRGGGAGSWGVITSATFQTFPTFNASVHGVLIIAPTTGDAGTLARIHAQHAFDWDDIRAGQYFYMYNFLAMPELGAEMGLEGVLVMAATYFKDVDEEGARREMEGFMREVRALEAQGGGVVVLQENVAVATGNELLYSPDGEAGGESVHASRLIPEWVYREKVEDIARVHIELLNEGVQQYVVR